MKDRYRLYLSTKFILLATIMALFFYGCSFAQKKQVKSITNKSLYKLYVDPQHRFQFYIPSKYNMKSNGNGSDYSLMTVTKADKQLYTDSKGIVLDLSISKQPMEQLIDPYFQRGKDDEYYFTGPFSDSLMRATKITGKGFTGLKRVNSCRTNADKTGQSTIVDGCEKIFLSNRKSTLSLTTYGIEIDKDDLEQITKSLKFFD